MLQSLKSLYFNPLQGVVCGHPGDHHFCSSLHKRSSEAIGLSVWWWCQWGGKRSLKMALKPTTNKRCPLSAGPTRLLEADSRQVSVCSFRHQSFRMVHIESVMEFHLFWYIWNHRALPCLPFFTTHSFELGASLPAEVRIIKWVVFLVYFISAFPLNDLKFFINLLNASTKKRDRRWLKRWCVEHLSADFLIWTRSAGLAYSRTKWNNSQERVFINYCLEKMTLNCKHAFKRARIKMNRFV